MATDPVTEAAPAKVNLCLHITGQRADGYHLLDSLVVFAGFGDRVTAAAKKGLSLQIDGPEGAGLSADGKNLVLRAARAMGVADAMLGLWKALPVASGIGGGSADAAATLRALSRLTGRAMPAATEVLALGADVPVCLAGRPARMMGVGEVLAPIPVLPPIWLVLVNPRVAVSTPRVFAALGRKENPVLPTLPEHGWADAPDLAQWLIRHSRNDLEAPARKLLPILDEIQVGLLAQPGCLVARMSGSGATCFGLFAAETQARDAEAVLQAARPGWWVKSAPVLS
jgi:4-diphosphocytidyl-2-C-methyl-D-erythritol kinase